MARNPAFFRNWNDLHIIVMVAAYRSFAAAAQDLGVDQTTVARRISDLEFRLGRPLFHRRTSGVMPTAICREILGDALPVTEAIRRVETRLEQVRDLRPCVTITAPPGVLTYTLEPALCSSSSLAQPLDIQSLRRRSLPALRFTSDPSNADISVIVTSEKALPTIGRTHTARRLGLMSFRPFASQKLKNEAAFRCSSFDDLGRGPLFGIKPYRHFSSLDAWNELCEGCDRPTVFDTTRELHTAFLDQPAVTLFPIYSHFYEHRIVPLEMPLPRMALSLWLSAHEDALLEPEIRAVYDAIGEAFATSSWFQ